MNESVLEIQQKIECFCMDLMHTKVCFYRVFIEPQCLHNTTSKKFWKIRKNQFMRSCKTTKK